MSDLKTWRVNYHTGDFIPRCVLAIERTARGVEALVKSWLPEAKVLGIRFASPGEVNQLPAEAPPEDGNRLPPS